MENVLLTAAVQGAAAFPLPAETNTFLCIGIVIYIGIMLLIGFLASRRISGIEDYLAAGRRLPLLMATATLLATWFGAGSSMGISATVYTSGLKGVIADPFGASLCLLLAGFFVVGQLRKKKCLTVTDIIARQYGRGAGIYATCSMLPVYVGWLGSLLLGIGTIINMLVDIDVTTATLAGAAIVLIYTCAGGMWAVTLTDIVQVSLITAGFLVILPGVVSEAGGFEHLYNSLSRGDLTLGVSAVTQGRAGIDDWVYYTGSWVVMGLGCMVGQDLVQRSLAAKDAKCASRSALIAGVLYFAIALIPVTVGFAARIVLPKYGITAATAGGNLENQILPQMAVIVLNKLHPVVLVLFFSALVSAVMSSADSCLLAGSSLFCNNVLKPLMPDISEKRFLLITRLSTVVFVAVSLFFALNIRNIYLLMKNSWVSQLVVVFLPVMTALYLPRSSKKAAWAGMLTSTVVWLGYCVIFSLRSSDTFWVLMNNFDRPLTCGAVYGFAAGAGAFFICFGVEEILRKNMDKKGVSR